MEVKPHLPNIPRNLRECKPLVNRQTFGKPIAACGTVCVAYFFVAVVNLPGLAFFVHLPFLFETTALNHV